MKKFRLTLFAAFLLLLFAGNLPAQFQINGSAFQTGPDCFTLTPNLGTQAGSIFWNTQISLNQDFDLSFQIFLGCNNGGADGAAFVLQPVSNSVGSSGGGLGYLGINPSFAVEFDTWQNATDPVYDHMAIQTNGVVSHGGANTLAGPVGMLASLPDVEDCQYHDVRFTWNATTQTFNAYWECNLRLTYTGNVVANIFNNNPNVYWGFTAATGGANNEQKFCLDYASFVTPAVDTNLCLGNAVQLDAGGGGVTYIWSPATGLSSTSVQMPIANPVVTTQYNIQVIDQCGISRYDSLVVTVNTPPVITLGNDTTICSGSSLTLDPGAGFASYLWQNNAVTQTLSASAAGAYSVTVTDNNGCTGTAGMNLSLNALPVVNLGNDTNICAGASLTVDAGAGYASYLWQNNTTQQTLTSSTAGQLSVTVTDNNGCQGSDQLNLGINALPVVNLGNDTAICTGANITFNGGPGFAAYQWQDNSNGQFYLTSTAGQYHVTVTDNNGCSGADTINLSLNALPVVNLGNDTAICTGASLTVDAGPGYAAYLWQDNSAGQTFTGSTAGQISVTVTDNNGCQGSDQLNLTLNALPVPNLGPDQTICPGLTATFNAGAGYAAYLWQNNSTAQTITTSTPGQVSVTVTDNNGCQGSDNANLSLFPAAVVNLGPDRSICDGSSITLSAGPGWTSRVWQDGSTGVTFQASAVGTYYVTVTNANGCIGSDTMQLVALYPLPVINLGNDTVICANLPLTLNPGPGFQAYSWSTGASTQTISVNQAGNYSVTVVDNHQCQGSDAISILGLDYLPTVDLGPDQQICEGDSIQLDPGSSPDTYLWNDGSTTQTIWAGLAGNYLVMGSNRCGTVSDNMNIGVTLPPVPNLGPDTSVCDRAVRLSPGKGFLSYLWQDGSNLNYFPVYDDGTYWVTVTNTCFARTDTVEVVRDCPPNMFFPTAFTPNGDGNNETFYPIGDPVDQFELLIFDRWGKLIFSSYEQYYGWNGDFQSKPVPEGVYVYTCKFRFTGKTEIGARSGSVTLIR
ncbi:MAG: gliding motility-associated C-terminal domain-containing protein [Bacteroidia bacterium]|nr:gliding motility-associated C-terminal domain-containing protein [Bacteroidia bacterium]